MRHNRTNKFWNRIQASKQSSRQDCGGAISIDKLEKYFNDKFSKREPESDCIKDAHKQVKEKYDSIKSQSHKARVSVFAVNRYLRRLRLGCSAEPDGIRTEHLKYAMDDSFALQLSILLSLCVAGGVLPDGFCVGTLIPVLQKSNIDPQNPKNYSPITVSSVLSKLLELYILEQCENYEFAESQYGYRGRGTDLATVMAHDISEYCVAQCPEWPNVQQSMCVVWMLWGV